MTRNSFSQLFRAWVHRIRRPVSPPVRRWAVRPGMELCEPRIVPASLPAVISTGQVVEVSPTPSLPFNTTNDQVTGFNPSVAVDPTNPTRMVAVAEGFNNQTGFVQIVGYYTVNSGATWTEFLDTGTDGTPGGSSTVTNLIDPSVDKANPRRYDQNSRPTVAFARDGQVYISHLTHNGADPSGNVSGALLVRSFDFTGNAPVENDLDPNDFYGNGNEANVLARWVGVDAMLNPFIAVDNNLPHVTDTDANGKEASQIDPIAGSTEVQQIAVSGASGTFTLTYDTDTTNPLPFNATAQQVQNELRALPAMGGANVVVTQNILGYLVTFTNDLGGVDVPELVAVGTGGTTALVTTNVEGVTRSNVYVVWNTNASRPTGFTGQWNPNEIMVASSNDNGTTFSAPYLVSDTGYFSSNTTHNFSPQVVFTQGAAHPAPDALTNGALGGQMVVGWATQFQSNGSKGRITTDSSRPSHVQVFEALSQPFATIPDPPSLPASLDDKVTIAGIPNSPDFQLTDIEISVAIEHATRQQLLVQLIAPDGLTTFTLIENRADAGSGNDRKIGNTTLGLPGGADVGFKNNQAGMTVFDVEAPRLITDAQNDPFIGRFQPESEAFYSSRSLTSLYGQDGSTLNGDWTLRVTDVRDDAAVTQRLRKWGLKLTGGMTSVAFGSQGTLGFDNQTGFNAAVPTVYSDYPLKPAASPLSGVGASFSMAVDNTLGAYSPYQNRVYLAYTDRPFQSEPQDDHDIILMTSDNGGQSFNTGVPTRFGELNDDDETDNFTEGNRPQFAPALTVDPVTGTLVAVWTDARFDASRARVSTYTATSIDGGETFSPQTYLNTPKQAIDALTGKVVTIEPVPSNLAANSSGLSATSDVGNRTAVVAVGGKVYGFWGGNQNLSGFQVLMGSGTYAAGPRVLSSDLGSVTADVPIVVPAGKTISENDGFYNDERAADGRRLLDGFTVTFDRPIDPSTFTPADIAVTFRNTVVSGASKVEEAVPVAEIIPLDGTNPVPNAPRPVGGNDTLATNFFVRFATPDPRTGTYRYTITPDVRDRIRGEQTRLVLGTPIRIDATVGVPRPILQNDFNFPYSSVTVPPGTLAPGEVLAKAAVNLDITHPSVGDLSIYLGSPGFGFNQLTQGGGFLPSGANFKNTTFSDAGVPYLGGGDNDPAENVFQPFQPLTGFFTDDPTGNWTLPVADFVNNGQNGTLNSWALILTPGKIVTEFVTGNSMDQDSDSVAGEITVVGPGESDDAYRAPDLTRSDSLPLTLPGPHVLEVGVPNQPETFAATTTDPNRDAQNRVVNGTVNSLVVTFDRDMKTSTFTSSDVLRITGPVGPIPLPPGTVAVQPSNAVGVPIPGAPTSRSFLVTFPTQTLSGTYVLEIGSDVQATTGPDGGDKLDTNLNAGVSIVRGTDPASLAPLVPTNYDNNADVFLFPGQAVTSIIRVSDDYIVSQDNVMSIQAQLNITHSNIPDLEAELISPDGTTVRLFSNIGAGGLSQSDFNNTKFSDFATSPIQLQNAPVPVGPFNPQDPLARFIGVRSVGDWTLRITNGGTQFGVLSDWHLTLPRTELSTGLGEPVADRISTGFRIFTQDPGNPQSGNQWTPIGPAAENSSANSGRVTGVAVDPSDPSGNTVFVGGASGGVWKTTNFLTTDPIGPTWIPLTDFGPTTAINVGGITVFPRNNDPNLSLVVVATGEGDSGTSGVGFLISPDGGRTWSVVDSTNNAGPGGGYSPISSPARNHIFVGTTMYKVVVDPRPVPDGSGNVIIYAAVSGTASSQAGAGGIWRSLDTGRTWTQVRAGNATDVLLAEHSEQVPGGNLQILYAGFRGEGVFSTTQATAALSLNLMAGNQGNDLYRDDRFVPATQIPMNNNGTPNAADGAVGRIVLAAPSSAASTGNRVLQSVYQGWLYAYVATPAGATNGLYLTKDFGRNWTKVNLPVFRPFGNVEYGTNDESRNPIDILTGLGPQGDDDIAIAVDPLNPNIVYLGGTQNSRSTGMGLIRVDVTTMSDTQAYVPYDNSDPGGGDIQHDLNNPGTGNDGPAEIKPRADGFNEGPGRLYSVEGAVTFPIVNTSYFNLIRDPNNLQDFVSDPTLLFRNIARFRNEGTDVRYAPFDAEVDTNVHRMLTLVDPISGRSRLIVTDDMGVASVVDAGDGTIPTALGFRSLPDKLRTGNLQISQFIYGAVQPSTLAADIAGALYYGMNFRSGNGFPVSSPDILDTGDLNWNGVLGNGVGVETDQSGSGTAYQYRFPCCGGPFVQPTDFFRLLLPGQPDVGRTTGLSSGDRVQWPFAGGFNFAVNPLDKNGAVIVSNTGQIYRSTRLADTSSPANWSPIGQPGEATRLPGAAVGTGLPLSNTAANAVAFGAPNPGSPNQLNNFIFVGNNAGSVFFTQTGGSPWTDISAGLDGTPVEAIVTNPVQGSREAFAVTQAGVYWKADANSPAGWVNITGNLFDLELPVFGGSAFDAQLVLTQLSALVADWRYANPLDPLDPSQGTIPNLYVGGDAGVYRLRKGEPGNNDPTQQWVWSFFPDAANEQAAVDGGYLPRVPVTDLDLSLGNINPATGLPDQRFGLNMLVATTSGRGAFAIRLPTDDPNNVLFQSGPRVLGVSNPNPVGGPSDRVRVTFDGRNPGDIQNRFSAVDPTTIALSDVVLAFDDDNNPATPSVPVNPTAIQVVSGPTATDYRVTVDILFAPLATQGFLDVAVGPVVSDSAGNNMNQDGDNVNGEPVADVFSTRTFLNGLNGKFVLSGLPAFPPDKATAGDRITVTINAQTNAGGFLDYDNQILVTTTDLAAKFGAASDKTGPFTVQMVDGVGTFDIQFRTASPGGTPWTVTAAEGPFITGTTSDTDPVTVQAGQTKTFALTGLPPTLTAGTVSAVTITSADLYGNPTKFFGTANLSKTDSKAVMPATAAVTNGTGSFQVEFRTAGNQSVSASELGGATGTTPNTLVVADAATRFGISAIPPSVTTGDDLTVSVAAFDRFDNTATGFNGPVTVSSTDPNAALLPAPGTVLPQPVPLTAGVGQYTFEFRTVGAHSVSVAGPSGTTGDTKSTTVVGGPASTFQLTGLAGGAVAGTPVTVTVQATDAFGNPTTAFNGSVSVSSTDTGAIFQSSPFTVTNGAGSFQVTFTRAGNQTLTLTGTGVSGTAPVSVTAGAAAGLDLTGMPATVSAGQTATVTVLAVDRFGNPTTGLTATITLASTDGQAVFPPTVPMTNGVATFQVEFRTAGIQTVTANGPGGIADTAGTSVTPRTLGQFVVSVPPNATVGVPVAVTIEARDRFGNAATTFNGTVVVSTTDGRAVHAPAVTLVNGTGSLTIEFRSLGAQTITARDAAGVASATASTTVAGAAATRFVLTGMPTTTTAGVAVTLNVQAIDTFDNVATGFNGTLPVAVSDGRAVSPTNVTLVNGVGTVTVEFRTSGAQSVAIGGTSGVPGTSAGTTVLPGAVARLDVTSTASQILVGDSVTVNLAAFDAFGNPAVNFSGPVSLISSDTSAILPGTALTAGRGSFVVRFGSTGTQTVTASVGSVSGTTVGAQVDPRVPTGPGRAAPLPKGFAAGTDAGFGDLVRVYNQNGTFRTEFRPYGGLFTGGVRVAVAARPNDQFEVLTVPGPGAGPDVRVFDSITGQQVRSFFAFEQSFTGGMFVAAGDFNRDGYADYVLTADVGGGPRVRILSGLDLTQFADFLGIDDKDFRGGARTAVGDVTGDGVPDLVVAAGAGGGPRVAVYDGTSITSGQPTKPFGDFFMYEPELRDGVYIAAGDVDGDGHADLIGGGGPGGGPRVFVLSGDGLMDGTSITVANFFTGDVKSRSGIRVSVADLDNDNRADVLTGPGAGPVARVTAFAGKTLPSAPQPPELFGLTDLDAVTDGVFVG